MIVVLHHRVVQVLLVAVVGGSCDEERVWL